MVDRPAAARCHCPSINRCSNTPWYISHDSKVLSQLIRLRRGATRLLAGYDISKVKCETPSPGLRLTTEVFGPWGFLALRVANQAKLVRDSKTSLCFHHYDRILYPRIPAPTPALGRARFCGFVHAALHKHAISLPALTIDLGSQTGTTGHGTGRVI